VNQNDVSSLRNIVLGRHSKVWARLQRCAGMADGVAATVGHAELANFVFTPLDRVWVLSYSRRAAENAVLLNHLAQAGVAEIVYVTSSSTIVSQLTACYEYPRVKCQAQALAQNLPNGRVLTIGLMYDQPSELPGGHNAATSYAELAAFMQAPHWKNGVETHLLRPVIQPHRHALERWAYRAYGALLTLAGSKPCLLRPLDALLRLLGARWYGYVYLSNRLWTPTIS
jgi:hypothetical protein